MKRRERWTVESPDRLPIEPRTYASEEQARRALARWAQRFLAQGFYGTATRAERIPVGDLIGRCTVRPVERS